MTQPTEIHDNLLIALRKIIRAIDLHSKQLVRQYGLTGPQMIILKTITTSNTSNINSKILAEKVSLSKATVTSIVDRLVDKGYVLREKSPTDRRQTYLVPTPKTKEIFNQNPNLLQEKFISQFAKLKEWQQYDMIATLERIADMMDAEKLDASPILINTEINQEK